MLNFIFLVFPLTSPSLGSPPPSFSLQPVGFTLSTHDSIDLSAKACILIGRSPSSDMCLMHPTCSRKHALIFHHANGSCYVVDCGSAHGTYVDGVRVESPTPRQGKKALIVPHKVRKGALLRFGGPDGPTFVLRSFPASLEGLVRSLSGDKSPSSVDLSNARVDGGSYSPIMADTLPKGETPSFMPTLAPSTPKACKAEPPYSPTSALVALNTRLNALGGGATLSHSNRLLAKKAASQLVVLSAEKDQIDFCLHGSKRFRCDDFPCSYDGEYCPESPTRIVKRFRSATFPLSPEPSLGGCLKVQEPPDTFVTPLVSQESLNTLEDEIIRKIENRRKVKFHDETERIYPLSITPDLPSSFDEEVQFASLKM